MGSKNNYIFGVVMQKDWRKRAISWLGKNSADQQKWAITYLGKKGWFDRGRRVDESNYDFLVTHIRNAPDLLKNENDIRKMKGAWTQKKKRDDKKGATKSYSFIMSESVGPKLKYLKKKRGEPAYKIVETLVSDYHQEVKVAAWLEMSQKQLEKRLKDVDQQLEELGGKSTELESREEELQRKEAELKRRTEELEQLEGEVLEYGEAVDNKRDLITQLFSDFTDAIHAHMLNQWVIRRQVSQSVGGREVSLRPFGLNYEGRSKASLFLKPYKDLLASLKR
ncbi:hypothetical protein MARSALSMR5_02709 [Marinobacter salarius]|uniref:Uncharacterized protein n=2 Tax=Marinobacter salarius TaxID=1420917 RepID=A0A1W6KBG1_9GAMM|nr:hypothetical protein MARSALSMR5_02709 [Marinobacter salarius]AZR39674.1 hypothetical protein MTMN5_00200 [Marinobacter salarius]